MIFLILPHYIVWHYSLAFIDIKNVWSNYLFFFYNLFSLHTLFSTLFSPWMKLNEKYKPATLFETLIFNTMMRIFGTFVRLIFILIGIALILLTFVFGLAFFIIWVALPFILFGVFVWSFGALIS